MPNIKIKIKDKIPSLLDDNAHIITYNSDYTLTFDFDNEWQNISEKHLLLLVKGKTIIDKLFTGNTVSLEPIKINCENYGGNFCEIGLYGGNLHTTTPLCVELWNAIS